MGRPREHDEQTRESLRAAAERLFAEHGPGGVSVRAVAEEVGTTTRAVYSLFGSREGLVVDALAQRAYELLTEGVLAHPETDDPAADLAAMGADVFRPFVLEHPALFRITFQRVIPDFEPGPELLEERQRALDALTAKVARLQEARLLRRGITVEAVVVAFQGMCEGLANAEMRGAIMRMLPDGDEEQAWRVAMDALLRGLTRR
jgi:AcrR family transcriptional regulator